MSRNICILSLSVTLSVMLLSSCTSVTHLAPGYQGPTASIDQTERPDEEKRNYAQVLAIDDKKYEFWDMSTLKPVFEVEAGKHRLLLRGSVVFFFELLNLAPPPHSEGWVDVNLSADQTYRVVSQTGFLGTSVWIEEAGTGKKVSRIVPPNPR